MWFVDILGSVLHIETTKVGKKYTTWVNYYPLKEHIIFAHCFSVQNSVWFLLSALMKEDYLLIYITIVTLSISKKFGQLLSTLKHLIVELSIMKKESTHSFLKKMHCTHPLL